MIVAVLVLVSAVILVTVLVPRLIEPLAGEMALPLPTRILMGVAGFLSANWMICVAAIIAASIGWRMWIGLPANRLRVDRVKLRAPLVGRLLRDVAVARFTRTLGTLVSSGIPILDALRITRDTLGNTAMMHAIDAVQEKVTSGAALAEPLERSGLFPPLLIQVVNLGERSGRLEYMLMHAATAFDRRVNNSIKLFTRALPPVLIMIMAALGGFVLAAIILPLLSLQSVVQ
jgi:type IV pilus assembly protein PilC